MFLAGLAAQIAGAPILSAILLFDAWLLILASVYRSKLFEGSPRRTRVYGNLLISCGMAAILALFWFTLLPKTSPEVMSPNSQEIEPISAAFIYQNRRLEIHNLGHTEFYVWGDKLGDKDSSIRDDRPCMNEPITVPHEPFHYYILGDRLENLVLSKVRDEGELRVPLYVFVTDSSERKFTIKCLLWIVVKNRQLTVHTQDLGLTSGWPEGVVPLPHSSAPCT
jgi:hypothetical protein